MDEIKKQRMSKNLVLMATARKNARQTFKKQLIEKIKEEINYCLKKEDEYLMEDNFDLAEDYRREIAIYSKIIDLINKL